MASENIMMEAVKKGGDRQELHERIRQHSIAAGKMVKEEGKENDLLSRLAADSAFGLNEEDCRTILDPSLYVGRSVEQVEEFLQDYIQPILDANRDLLGEGAELSV